MDEKIGLVASLLGEEIDRVTGNWVFFKAKVGSQSWSLQTDGIYFEKLTVLALKIADLIVESGEKSITVLNQREQIRALNRAVDRRNSTVEHLRDVRSRLQEEIAELLCEKDCGFASPLGVANDNQASATKKQRKLLLSASPERGVEFFQPVSALDIAGEDFATV